MVIKGVTKYWEDDVVKKLVSMLLAVLMVLAPVFAMAEAASEVTYATYQNETNGYAIDYPETWSLLSKENVQSMIDSVASGETKIEGMDPSVLETYKSQIEAMDMVMFMSADGAVNANLTYQAVPMLYTSDALISQMYPVAVQQFQSMFKDYTELAAPQVETVGDKEFVETAGQYTLSGMSFIMLQAHHCTDKFLYTVTFTINTSLNPDMAAIDTVSSTMLESLVPA